LIMKLEKLSMLQLTDEERSRMKEDLRKILKFFQTIASLNLEEVEPTFHPLAQGKLRKDVVRPSLLRDLALMNAVRGEGGYIKGPRTGGE